MATRQTNWDRFRDAMGESFTAMRKAVRKEGARGFRFSRRLVQEIEEGSVELAKLGRRAARSPGNVGDLYQASVDLARRGASHSSDLAQELLGGARAAGSDVRDTATTVIRANRHAGQALAAALRGGTAELARDGARPARPASKAKGRRRVTSQAKAPTVKASTRARAPARKKAAAARKPAR